MQALLRSLLIHGVIFGSLWLALRSSSIPEEIPIELTEFLRAAQPSGAPKPKSQPPKAKAVNANSESGTPSLSAASTASSSGGTGIGETVVEEYEVSELPVILNEVRVPYPPSARSRGIQGSVIFDLIVSSKGEVASAKVVKSPAPELTDAALSAVQKFRFKPARFKDKPVAIQIRYTYRFILE
ncbi:MAG: TonB family protein [Bdellovibrionales bacterium]|nr:TonB family protein [Bdellovibrionales bacterium]